VGFLGHCASAWTIAAAPAHGSKQEQRMRPVQEHTFDPEQLQRPPQLLLGLRQVAAACQRLTQCHVGDPRQ